MIDIWQQFRIEENSRRQNSAERNLASTKNSLEGKMAKMALVSQALYELLKETTGVTDEDLRRKIKEVDARDGKEDGKVQASVLKCPKCGSAVSAGALYCQMCGAMIAPKYPFEL